MTKPWPILALLSLCACPKPVAEVPDAGTPVDGGVVDAGSPQDAGSAEDAGVPPEGLELLSQLAGLWAGPATMTPLGDFPTMNVDFRAASPYVEFGRVDLGPGNALRFAFQVETFEGRDVLSYRNGGYFQGSERDMRTRLVERDPARAFYRFCHVTQGCGYIDATYDFDPPDRLTFNVKVKGAQHLFWSATRKEARSLPAPFPTDLRSQGPGTAPFPDMPELRATVSWSTPLPAEADVWLLLSTTRCGLTGACTPSRSFRQSAAAGSSSATLELVQLHAGSYRATAIVDRNRNMQALLQPDLGDSVALDAELTVAPSGRTTFSLNAIP